MMWLIDPAVVVAANVLGGAMALPQALHIVRTGQVGGVSANWVVMSVIVNAWWLVYAFGVADPAIAPVAAVSVVGYLAIAVALRVHGGRAALSLAPLPLLVALVVPALGLASGSWAVLGVVLGVVYGFQLAPAVIEAWRCTDLGGISVGTWTAAWLEALLWGVYGFRHGDAGLVALALAGLVMSSAVLAQVGRRRLQLAARIPATG